MEIEAAKVIGAGLAVIGVIGSGIGIGNIFSSFIEAVGRNPAARSEVFTMTMFCLLYTSPSPRDRQKSRMPSSA